MNAPTLNATRNVAADVDQLGTYIPVPGIGHFAVNAFLLRSREPVLVDAGIVTMQEPMLAALESLIDPRELRWIYLTHVDGDHVGCVEALLRRAPKARIVTTFLGWSKLGFARMNRTRSLRIAQSRAGAGRRRSKAPRRHAALLRRPGDDDDLRPDVAHAL
jgi:glyoxylase-like metal-dependent hydrolase (beta-lactamase superfamily II)